MEEKTELKIISSSKYRTGYIIVTESADDNNFCYEWSNGGGKSSQNTKPRVVCAGCRRIKDKGKNWPEGQTLKSLRIDRENNCWVDDYTNYPHVCHPIQKPFIEGQMIKRKVLTDLSNGTIQSSATGYQQVNLKIAEKDCDQETRNVIRNAAINTKNAAKRSMWRALKSHFPTVSSLSDLKYNPELQGLHLSLQGSKAKEGQFFDDRLIIGCYNKMTIFSSKRQLFLLKKSREWICDGTFAFAPQGTYQIYRILGFVSGKAFPFVTVLMNKKNEKWYMKLWRILRENIAGRIKLKTAHFDYEPAAISSFKRNFPEAQCKMCCFHVKQALDRKLSSKGLGLCRLYRENYSVKKVVRMIGAMQFTPQDQINKCIELIKLMIDANEEISQRQKNKLKLLLEYYQKTWIKNPMGFDFFPLYQFKGQRTTNAAEAYHSRQHHFYRRKHLSLGEWITTFREVTAAEEEDAMAIYNGIEDVRNEVSTTVTERLERWANELREFLEGGEYTREEYNLHMAKYLSRVGRAIGIGPRELTNPNNTINNTNAGIDANMLGIDGAANGNANEIIDDNEGQQDLTNPHIEEDIAEIVNETLESIIIQTENAHMDDQMDDIEKENTEVTLETAYRDLSPTAPILMPYDYSDYSDQKKMDSTILSEDKQSLHANASIGPQNSLNSMDFEHEDEELFRHYQDSQERDRDSPEL